jgi:uncharacterized protein (DUF58 family)
MPTRRGWAALAAGLCLWVAARVIGSEDLHMVAVGVTALPVLAAVFVRWNRVRLALQRHLSGIRVFPGTRVVVSLTVENQGEATAPFLLVEDALSPSLGPPARVVVSGIPPGLKETVSYSLLARRRGHYVVGPASTSITDPFGLALIRVRDQAHSELVVYPEVEEIEPWRLGIRGAGAGESTVRQLYRSAAEFYTMREYVTGDDLRRIHWPSVARTGQLMIRQDESTRRSVATLFLDNRNAALGGDGSPGFERAVSVTASIGRALFRGGFAVHFATVDGPGRPVTETNLLEALAEAAPVRTAGIGEALAALRAIGRTDTSLVLVAAPPSDSEVAGISRIGSQFGRKLAVLVYRANPAELPPHPAAELHGRALASRAALQHAGWTVVVIEPDRRLIEAWDTSMRPRGLRAAGLPSS